MASAEGEVVAVGTSSSRQRYCKTFIQIILVKICMTKMGSQTPGLKTSGLKTPGLKTPVHNSVCLSVDAVSSCKICMHGSLFFTQILHLDESSDFILNVGKDKVLH